MKTKNELYEQLMVIAHKIEDILGYDETEDGIAWGDLVNKLQEFKFSTNEL